MRKLVLDILEAEVHAEGGSVLLDQPARLAPLRLRAWADELDAAA
jgi:hypothetical protein